MKKRSVVLAFVFLLAFSVFCIDSDFYPDNAKTNDPKDSRSGGGKPAYVCDLSDERFSRETIQNKLKDDVPVAVYSENASLMGLYPFFKELKVPVFLTLDEAKTVEREYRNLFQTDDRKKLGGVELPFQNSFLGKNSEKAAGSAVPVILIIPMDGKLFVEMQEVITNGEKKGDLQRNVSDAVNSTNLAESVAAYRSDLQSKVLPRAAEVAASGNARFLACIRKTQTVYGDFRFAGQTHYNRKACRNVTDFLIYNAEDSDPDFDHLIVEGISRVDPFPALNDGPPYATRAFQAVLDNYYGSDTLIDWSPNTLGLDLVSGGICRFSPGLPLSAPFSYVWGGESSTFMQGVGDKNDQCYRNLFVRNQYGGLCAEPFTVQYSALYRSAGTLLRLYYRSPAGLALDGAAAGYTWYGNSYSVLEYDY